jgi:hypothetical protein
MVQTMYKKIPLRFNGEGLTYIMGNILLHLHVFATTFTTCILTFEE